MGANTIEITDANFDTEVMQSASPVLIDFWAAWCAPCRALAPTVDAIADQFKGKVKVGKMDVDASPNTPGRYAIRTIPTLLLIKGGQVKEQLVGAHPQQRIADMLNKHL